LQEAAKWYTLAAAQKFVDAQINVGSLCAQGQGVLLEPQDRIQNYWAAYRIWRKIEQLSKSGKRYALLNARSLAGSWRPIEHQEAGIQWPRSTSDRFAGFWFFAGASSKGLPVITNSGLCFVAVNLKLAASDAEVYPLLPA
jgi:hypothetical protein